MGTVMLGVVVTFGLVTAAGFSYADVGMAEAGLLLGLPGVAVGPTVLGVVIWFGLVTAAGILFTDDGISVIGLMLGTPGEIGSFVTFDVGNRSTSPGT